MITDVVHNDVHVWDSRISEDRCHSSLQSKAIYPLHPPLQPLLHHLKSSLILASQDRKLGCWSFICPWWLHGGLALQNFQKRSLDLPLTAALVTLPCLSDFSTDLMT
jgi:hypothetical protein